MTAIDGSTSGIQEHACVGEGGSHCMSVLI